MSAARLGPFTKVLLAATVVLLAACLLAPPAYWIGQALRETWPAIPDYPFHRYFSRIAQVGGIAAAICLVWWAGIRRPADLGLTPNPRAARDTAAGLLTALLPALLLGVILLTCDIYRIRRELPLEALGRIVLTAGFVAVIEEFFFRGILLGIVRKSLGDGWGVLIVSMIFAAAHFLRPGKAAVEVVGWESGFMQVAAVGSALPPWPLLGWGLASLFVAGLLLAWCTVRTRSLWLAIGIHAGWVLGQQGLNWYAKFRIKPPEELLPWVGPSLVSGVVPTGLGPLLALGMATALAAGYLHFLRRAPGS